MFLQGFELRDFEKVLSERPPIELSAAGEAGGIDHSALSRYGVGGQNGCSPLDKIGVFVLVGRAEQTCDECVFT